MAHLMLDAWSGLWGRRVFRRCSAEALERSCSAERMQPTVQHLGAVNCALQPRRKTLCHEGPAHAGLNGIGGGVQKLAGKQGPDSGSLQRARALPCLCDHSRNHDIIHHAFRVVTLGTRHLACHLWDRQKCRLIDHRHLFWLQVCAADWRESVD